MQLLRRQGHTTDTALIGVLDRVMLSIILCSVSSLGALKLLGIKIALKWHSVDV